MHFNFNINYFAWIIIVLNLINIIGGPFVIGEPRKPASALSYVFSLFMFIIILFAMGVIQ